MADDDLPRPPPRRCIHCRGELAEHEHWFVRDFGGDAHTRCVSWATREAPYGHMLRKLDYEVATLRDESERRWRRRLAASIRKMHAQWPKDAVARVTIVDDMIRRGKAWTNDR